MTDSLNPYEAPDPVEETTETDADLTTLNQFRQEVLALGVLWLICGGVCLLVATVAAVRQQATENILVSGSVGVLLTAIGVPTLFKKKWALYAGCLLCLVGATIAVVRFNICGLVIPLIVGLQAFRVVKYARRLEAIGVPLTTKPA